LKYFECLKYFKFIEFGNGQCLSRNLTGSF